MRWVKTPDLLKLWGYSEQAHCKLCGHPQCTLHHIISNCKGHDTYGGTSLLLYLKLQELIDNVNANSATNNTSPNRVNFVRAGENKPPTKTKSSKSTFLSGATDWRLLVELEETRSSTHRKSTLQYKGPASTSSQTKSNV